MSVSSEITRITGNVTETYEALEGLGAAMPAAFSSDNLAETARSVSAVLYTEQTLTSSQKQQARTNISAAAGDHTHTPAEIGAAASSHTHSQYYDSSTSRTANTVLAAPSGSAGSASFRNLVAADLPTVTVAKGGTGATSAANARTNLGVSAAGVVKVGSTNYTLRTGTAGAAGYITLVLE